MTRQRMQELIRDFYAKYGDAGEFVQVIREAHQLSDGQLRDWIKQIESESQEVLS